MGSYRRYLLNEGFINEVIVEDVMHGGTLEVRPAEYAPEAVELNVNELIPSHRPTLDLIREGADRTYRAPRARIESIDFHNMLMNEDVQRISFLGDQKGILTVTSRFGEVEASTLRLWSSPESGNGGAFSKLNPPRVLQELNFESKLDALAVRQDGRMVAIATEGILGLYSLVGTSDEAYLRLRVSLAVDSSQNGRTCDVSFGAGGQHLRIVQEGGEPYLLSLKGL